MPNSLSLLNNLQYPYEFLILLIHHHWTNQLSCAQFFELAESEICEDQPEPVVAEYDGELNDDDHHENNYDKFETQISGDGCLTNYADATIRPCNTWR